MSEEPPSKKQKTTETETSEVLRVGGVPEHFNLPFHLALKARVEGVDAESFDASRHHPSAIRAGPLAPLFEWTDQPGGTGQMVTNLKDKKLDVITALTEGIVHAVEAKRVEADIAAMYIQSPLQWGEFVPAHSRFQNEAELKGARIAISRFGSGSHLMAYVMAKRLGWTLTKEQFVLVDNLEGARKAFKESNADLFLWDRFMTRPLVQSGEFRQVGIQPTPWPCVVFASRSDLSSKLKKDLQQLITAVQAEASLLHTRADVLRLVMQYGLDEETAQEWLKSIQFAKQAEVDPAMLKEVLSYLKDAGTL